MSNIKERFINGLSKEIVYDKDETYYIILCKDMIYFVKRIMAMELEDKRMEGFTGATTETMQS